MYGYNTNLLQYKDFIGTVAFSEADGVFFGKIAGIDELVNSFIRTAVEKQIAAML